MGSGFVYLRPLNVAVVRAKGPYSTSAAQAWKKMFDWLYQSGVIQSVGTGYGLLLDDPRVVAADDCRYEACIELAEDYRSKVPEDFAVRRLPGGAYARQRHIGGVSGLSQAISKLRNDWVPTQGLVIDHRRPVIEIYLDNPNDVPLDKQRVDICMPVTVADELGRSAA